MGKQKGAPRRRARFMYDPERDCLMSPGRPAPWSAWLRLSVAQRQAALAQVSAAQRRELDALLTFRARSIAARTMVEGRLERDGAFRRRLHVAARLAQRMIAAEDPAPDRTHAELTARLMGGRLPAGWSAADPAGAPGTAAVAALSPPALEAGVVALLGAWPAGGEGPAPRWVTCLGPDGGGALFGADHARDDLALGACDAGGGAWVVLTQVDPYATTFSAGPAPPGGSAPARGPG